MYLYTSLALTIASGIGFTYGVVRFFRKKSALYVRMIVFAVGCAMLGRLFETLQLLVTGTLNNGFNVGMLGIIGSFLFLFSANFGQMDSIVDDHYPEFRKTRLIALAAPIAEAVIWLLIVAANGINSTTVWFGVEAVFIAQASYFHLKHLIINDIDYGLIRAIRNYNLLALVYALLCMLEMLVKSFNLPAFFAVAVCVLQFAVLLVFLPILERGVKKWTT